MALRASIRIHLLRLVLAVAVPLVALQAWNLYSAAQADARHAREQVYNLARITASDTARFLAQAQDVLNGLAARPAVSALDPARCDPVLKDFRALAPRFANVVTLALDGTVVCSAQPNPRGSRANPDYFLRRMRGPGELTVGKAAPGVITGKWVVPIGRPLLDSRGNVAGAVVLPVDLVNFPVLPGVAGMPGNWAVGLIALDGTVLARSLEAERYVGTRLTDSVAVREKDGTAENTGEDGIPRVIGFTPVPGTDWIAFASVPASEIYAGGRTRIATSALIALATLLLSLLLAVRWSRAIGQPVGAIASAANQVAAGKFAAHATVEGPAEIAQVATQFNAMLDSLASSQSEYRSLASASPVGIYRTDAAGDVTYVNARWCELAGMSEAEALNDGWMKTVRADRERLLAEINAGAKLRARFESEFRVERPDGSTVTVLANAVPELDAAGAVAGYVGAVVDITALRAADRAVREADARFQTIFRAAPMAGTVSTMEDGRVLEANDAFCALVGKTREAVFGRSVLENDTWADPRERAALVEQLQLRGRVRDLEVHIRHSGGEILDVLMSAERIDYLGQACTLQMGVDITARKRAEAALQESKSRLDALTRQLLEIQETERRTLARELHDEVGGVLTAVKLNLQSLRGKGRGDLGEAALADGLALVDGAIEVVRSLSLNLRPAVLDDLGLIPALRWYCHNQAQRAGIPIELTLEAIDLKAAPQLESACYRFVQETVTNALRHARAHRIQVALHRDDRGLILEIADDGAGFDAEAAHKRALAGQCSGLLGMEERARLAGGRLAIDTAPGAGTRVRFEVAAPEGGFA